MKALELYLPWLLSAAAIGQAMIAVLNLSLERLMHWGDAVEAMPLLVRQVFRVHGLFISVTLAIFAVLTWRFAGELQALALGRWLAAGIAAFWGIRTVVQVVYYSAEHWRGQPARLAMHLMLLAVYGGLTLVYGLTAAGW